MFRITVWVAAGVAVGAAALPTSASADSVKRYEQTGVPRSVVERFALTDDERRALDISSMRVTGAEGFGVMVEVRLHGDFQRRIGRSGLRRGALAVSLHSGASTVTVLTRGEAVRSQRVLRSPAGTAAVAVRTGRTVRVFVHTTGFGAVERVEAVSFARGPAAPSDLRGSTQADTMEVRLDPVETTPTFASCDELEHIYDGITRALGGTDELVFRLERLAAGLAAELRRTRAKRERLALRRALSKLRSTHRVARSQLGLLLSISGDGEQLLEECYQPRDGGCVKTFCFEIVTPVAGAQGCAPVPDGSGLIDGQPQRPSFAVLGADRFFAGVAPRGVNAMQVRADGEAKAAASRSLDAGAAGTLLFVTVGGRTVDSRDPSSSRDYEVRLLDANGGTVRTVAMSDSGE